MKKRMLSFALTLCMVISLLPGAALAADVNSGVSTGPRSATSSGNVFLGNDKLELGINECGCFGSTVTAPSNFHPWTGGDSSKPLGMRTYSDETAGWDSASDFFLPYTVDEGFAFAWAASSGDTAVQHAVAQSRNKHDSLVDDLTHTDYTVYSTTDHSTADELKAVTNATVDGTLSYTQTVSFGEDSGIAGVQVVLKNTSDSALYNLEYVRGFDPDQGNGSGAYATDKTETNNYYYTDSSDGTVWVIATANPTPNGVVSFEDFTNAAKYPFIFMAPHSNDYTVTPVKQRVGWSAYTEFKDVTSESSPYKLGSSVYDDVGIGLRFHIPSLAAGDSVTLYYNMSLDADIASALAQLMGGNLAAQPESYVANKGDTVKLSVDMETLFPGAVSGTTYTYQWKSCSSEDGTYENIPGAAGGTYEAPTAAAGTTFYQCTVTPNSSDPVTTGRARVTVLADTATTYAVDFDANTTDTVTNMPGEQTVKTDDMVLEPTPPVRDGYVLAGWYTEPAYTHLWNFASAPLAAMTLYAKWIKIPVPTVTMRDGKISAAHCNASDGQALSTYTIEYSHDNGSNWHPYTTDEDGTGMDFTRFSADGDSGTTAAVLFRQVSTIDGISGITGTTSAVTLYKVDHSIADGDGGYGVVTLAVTGAGATGATDIGSMGSAYPAGATLTYRATPSAGDTSYLAGINHGGKFTDLPGTFAEVASGKYCGGTYTFDSLSAAQSSTFYFGNWKAELAAAFADTGADHATDLKAALGDSGSEQRAVFTALFPDVSLTTYDKLTDKEQLLTQYVGRTASHTADGIAADLNTSDSDSAFESCAETQSKLEGTPTCPKVSVNPTTGIAAVTIPVTNPTVTVKGSDDQVITAEPGTYTYNLAGKISDAPSNYITVQVTDAAVNYDVTVRTYVNVSTYKVEENCADLDPAVGGTVTVNSDSAGEVESTLNDSVRADDIYTIQNIQWQKSDDTWSVGSLPSGQPYKTTLTASPDSGAYFVGFQYGQTLYTPENATDFKTACGDSAATIAVNKNGSSNPSDWAYTLTYTPKDKQAVTAQYRNLLGEINAAATNDEAASVISDSKYAAVMPTADGKQLKGTDNLTGDAAKEAFNNVSDSKKTTVLTKLLCAISERESGYTIAEFNDALYWTSTLQQCIDEATAKVEDAYTAGSWAERQNVLANVKNEYDAADGDQSMTTSRVEALCKQMQAALDQLTTKTLAVEIVTNADGATNRVRFDAANPSQSGIPVSDGQNGYAFPVYNTGVTLSITPGADYNVTYLVNDTAVSSLDEVNTALTGVKEHTQVRAVFTKKTVGVTLCGGVQAVTADADGNTEGLQVNRNEDAEFRVVPGEGQILIPGAAVNYTVGGGSVQSASIQPDGTFVVSASGDIIITDVSAAVKDLGSDSLTALLDALKAQYDSGCDTLYNAADLNWTQESWEALFGADNEGGVYGGVYGDALAVANDAEATADQLQGAVDALTGAVNALKPQYTVTLADGFTVQGAADSSDNPQTGIVKMDGIWYAAEGAGLSLDVTVPDGKNLNKISYTMGGQTLYAWASNGAVTIYGISGTVGDLMRDTSDKGFSVTPVTGGIGSATGAVSGGNTYTLTPEEGSALVSITLDGLKTAVPDDAELAGVVWAAFADDPDSQATLKINGSQIQFTKDSASGKITGTLPKVGKVQISASGSTVTAAVIESGSAGYEADTVITLTTDADAEHAITAVKVQPAGAEYGVTFGSPAAGATVTWANQNTGAHSVTAVTELRVYTVTIADDGAEPPVSVGGITADKSSVKCGGTVVFTIPAPADAGGSKKEVSLDSTVTFTVGGTSGSGSLADLNDADNGVSAVINADGSATLTATGITGSVNVTAAVISAADRGSAKAGQGLAADKTLFTQKLTALQAAITEADQVKTNAGKIYDESTAAWTALTDGSTGEIKGKSDLDTSLSAIVLNSISDEASLASSLETALGVPGGTKTLDQLLTMIDTAAGELTAAADAAKIHAAGVVSIPEITQYQGGGESVPGLTARGSVGTDPTSAEPGVINPADGAALVISDIKTDAGYLPVLTYTEEGTDGGSCAVVLRVAKDAGGYKVQIASVDSEGSITGWTDTDDVTVTAATEPSTQAGTFTASIPNGKLIAVLGEDTDADMTKDSLGNITTITVGTYSVGQKMSTAQEILDSAVVGSTSGISQVDIDADNDNTPDFRAGSTDKDQDVTPVISDDATASISFAFTADSYKKGLNTWYKEFYGVVIDGVTYTLDADGKFPENSGLTYAETRDPDDVLKITAGKVTIDTSVYPGKLTGIELLCRPTNSQYTTYVDEYDEVKTLCGEDLSGMSTEQIENVLKQIKRLIAQSTGTYAAEPSGGVNEYYLTQENKDYLATEIEQIKLLERKLSALKDAKSFTDAADELYEKAADAGLALPLTAPITDEQKAIMTKLAAEIETLESQYNDLTDYEKTLVSGDAKGQLDQLSDAVEMAREDGMTDEEVFAARVDTIEGMITGSDPYTVVDPDLALERIHQAYDSYDKMSNDEQADAAAEKALLDELKDELQTYTDAQAAEFAKKYLTTDYDGGTAFDNTNRLDSDKTTEEYDNRVSLARESYDDLPACVKSAADSLFKSPTVPQLYAQTFPNVDSLLDVDDATAADNFISTYLTISGSAITDATADTYQKALDAESAWNNLAPAVQAEVNSKLTGDYGGKTYPELLELAKRIDGAVTGSDMAAKDFIAQHLTCDGAVITSVTDSSKSTVLSAKSAWDELEAYVQAAVDKLLKDTYKGKTYSALYQKASASDPGHTGSTSGTTGTDVPVIVDGTTYNIGTQKTTNGVTTVTPKQSKLEKQLESAEKGGNVTVPIRLAPRASAGAASLVLKNIEDMAEKNITLTVAVDGVSYEMPTANVDTAKLMTELGASKPSDIPVTVSIIQSDKKTQSAVQADLEKLGADVVAAPLEFKVTATYGGKTAEVTRFEGYVSRTVEVSREKAQQITTAVVHEQDGTIRHVPTFVYEKDGKWYAKINSRTNSTYALIYNEQAFADAADKWYEDAVNEMDSRKIVEGREDGKFHGEDSITRASFAAILVRALGLPADGDAGVFTDVPESAWYCGAVGTAYEYGLIYGKTATTFAPMDDITRQEAMVMMARAAKVAALNGKSGELANFLDAEDVDIWALDGVKFNVGSGLIVGKNDRLCPTDKISRAESATVILRLLQKSELVDVRSNP